MLNDVYILQRYLYPIVNHEKITETFSVLCPKVFNDFTLHFIYDLLTDFLALQVQNKTIAIFSWGTSHNIVIQCMYEHTCIIFLFVFQTNWKLDT